MKAKLHIVGLDPALGFFHALGDNRASLAFDMMEEFRPSVSDIVILTLVLNGQITLADFENSDEAGRPIRLSKEGREVLIKAYEERLSDEFYHPMAQGVTAIRASIEYQARQIRWIVEGKASQYEPFQLQ